MIGSAGIWLEHPETRSSEAPAVELDLVPAFALDSVPRLLREGSMARRCGSHQRPAANPSELLGIDGAPTPLQLVRAGVKATGNNARSARLLRPASLLEHGTRRVDQSHNIQFSTCQALEASCLILTFIFRPAT